MQMPQSRSAGYESRGNGRAHERFGARLRWREDRVELIAAAAYGMAQSRGFTPGHEIEDWLEAESLVNDRLSGEGRAY